jgi:hypothetical protein
MGLCSREIGLFQTAKGTSNLTSEELNLYLDRYATPRQGNLGWDTKLRRLREVLGCAI